MQNHWLQMLERPPQGGAPRPLERDTYVRFSEGRPIACLWLSNRWWSLEIAGRARTIGLCDAVDTANVAYYQRRADRFVAAAGYATCVSETWSAGAYAAIVWGCLSLIGLAVLAAT